jgi:hypothetical protein
LKIYEVNIKTHMAYDKDNTSDAEIVDTIKQKSVVTVARLMRYRKSQRRKNDKRFKINEKSFMQKLGKQKPLP